jgi:hypothetical protein
MKTPIGFSPARYSCSLLLLLCGVSQPATAGWSDLLKIIKGEKDTAVSVTALSDRDITAGLKEALARGTEIAIDLLGRENGYLGNAEVRIPMPESLQNVESALRRLGQDKVADNFIESMNHAAEQAVPEATAILADAIQTMTISDARDILHGSDDAATRYFRRTSEDKLRERFAPIVSLATDSVGVTARYKELTGRLGMMSALIDTGKLDIDGYVTGKAMDGLFFMIASEEKKIRENPVARTTELLQRVFR